MAFYDFSLCGFFPFFPSFFFFYIESDTIFRVDPPAFVPFRRDFSRYCGPFSILKQGFVSQFVLCIPILSNSPLPRVCLPFPKRSGREFRFSFLFKEFDTHPCPNPRTNFFNLQRIRSWSRYPPNSHPNILPSLPFLPPLGLVLTCVQSLILQLWRTPSFPPPGLVHFLFDFSHRIFSLGKSGSPLGPVFFRSDFSSSLPGFWRFNNLD